MAPESNPSTDDGQAERVSELEHALVQERVQKNKHIESHKRMDAKLRQKLKTLVVKYKQLKASLASAKGRSTLLERQLDEMIAAGKDAKEQSWAGEQDLNEL